MNHKEIFFAVFCILLISCNKNSLNECGTVTDIDGNIYNTVKIGNQCWMAENLKTTRYNDGTPIATGLSNSEWVNTTSGAYAYYDDNSDNNTTYGKLYNWYAVNTGKLAPAGCHVPTDSEWATLINYLGGELLAGGKMKTNSYLWESPNVGASNSSDFSGFPGGMRGTRGDFVGIGYAAYWWSSTKDSQSHIWYCGLYYDWPYARRDYDVIINDGQSVRCIKN